MLAQGFKESGSENLRTKLMMMATETKLLRMLSSAQGKLIPSSETHRIVWEIGA